MLKYLNQNITDKEIIIILRNRSLKGLKPLMTFLILGDHDTLLDDTLDL
jgi:hypothetical protein